MKSILPIPCLAAFLSLVGMQHHLAANGEAMLESPLGSFSTSNYEAESATKLSGCSVESKTMPYIGAGYVRMAGKGSLLEWNNIRVKAKGKYTLLVKYANGSGAPLACDLMVNGSAATRLSLTPDPDPDHEKAWRTYWNARATVDLNEGINTVKLVGAGSGVGPIIDNIAVSSGGLAEPPARRFNVKDYGARSNDPNFDNTAAIQKAIDACVPGGAVVLTDGTYMSGHIKLKSDMTLWIAETATLKAIRDNNAFPRLRPAVGANPTIARCFVYAEGANNLVITGGGKIDDNGGIPMWDGRKVREGERPTPVWLRSGKNIAVRNIDIVHSVMWTLVPEDCEHVIIDGVNIDCRFEDNGAPTENADGIDIDDCHDVVVTNCALYTEDDIICAKSHSSKGVVNLTVKNITGNSTNDNFIKFGTATYGCFRNILVEDGSAAGSKFRSTGGLTGISLAIVDGGEVDNVVFDKIQLTGFGTPIFLMNAAGRRGHCPGGAHKRAGDGSGPVKNITIKNLVARNTTDKLGASIMGIDWNGTYSISNVTLQNVDVECKGGVKAVPKEPSEYSGAYPESNRFGNFPAWGYYLRHAKDVRFINCKQTVSPADARNPVVEVDCTGVQTVN